MDGEEKKERKIDRKIEKQSKESDAQWSKSMWWEKSMYEETPISREFCHIHNESHDESTEIRTKQH